MTKPATEERVAHTPQQIVKRLMDVLQCWSHEIGASSECQKCAAFNLAKEYLGQ